MNGITGVLERVRSGIVRKAYPNETAVRMQIVQPVLHALGWDVFDPDRVCAEYPLKHKATTRRIDLALCVSKREPRCIIELKSIDYALKQIGQSDGDLQLFEYCFHAGAPLALLTNGKSWRFYSPQRAGTYADRLVNSFDIETDSLDNVAEWLQRYLSYSNTKSGKAADFASKDLDARLARNTARDAIPQAWAQLVGGKVDDGLMRLLTEAVLALVECSPRPEDVAAFLKSCRRSADDPFLSPPPEGDDVDDVQEAPSQGKVRYWLFGQQCNARSAKSAYMAIIEALVERDPSFLSQLHRGTKKYVARSLQEWASNKRVQENGVPLKGGWFLNTYLNNHEKQQRLEKVCAVAGVRFGDRSGLKISLPDGRR